MFFFFYLVNALWDMYIMLENVFVCPLVKLAMINMDAYKGTEIETDELQ